MQILNRKDFASGLGFVGLGTVTALGALRYDLGSASAMGPGYFPLLCGVVLALLGALVIAGACAPGEAVGLERWSLPSILIVLAALLIFAVALEPLGLVVALPLLVAISSAAHPGYSWRTVLMLIAVLLPLVWAVFVLFLGLTFPMLPAFLG